MNPLRLPHAYPFLLLDRVVSVDPGRYAVATKNLTRTDPLLGPRGILPPVLLVEVMTQAAGVAVGGTPDTPLGAASSGAVSPASGMLVRIDRFRARGAVGAGDQLHVYVRIVRVFGDAAMAHAVVTVDGRRCAAAELVLKTR